MHEISNQLKAFAVDNFGGFSPKTLPNFILGFLVCGLLAFILGRLYMKYGNSLSNRKSFAKNFIILSIATMFIITVVKSSLALSLGLVGALSIVRFRTAIKEPEELMYLFICIAIGLGTGAGLTVLTIIAFLGFSIWIVFNHKPSTMTADQALYLTITGAISTGSSLKKYTEALMPNCSSLKLKRVDETEDKVEATFIVEFKDFDDFERAKTSIRELDRSASISFMDNSRDF